MYGVMKKSSVLNRIKISREKNLIGWREWISLPDLGVQFIKVKSDSGARTSALHVTDISHFKDDSGRDFVKFRIYPLQHRKDISVESSAPVTDMRWIKSSVGHKTLRPVIRTTLLIGNHAIQADITLINRDLMGFRMLLGRTALRKNFFIHPGKSFLLSTPLEI
jgi:hypothetical protein